VGDGSDLYSHGQRLCVCGGHHGLVQPQGLGLAGIQISTDGKGSWVDNVYVERLWRSLKYEEVYLKVYDSVSEARSDIGNYFRFYNREHRHQSLDRQTQDQVYEGSVMWPVAA
jgi:putative transposase